MRQLLAVEQHVVLPAQRRVHDPARRAAPSSSAGSPRSSTSRRRIRRRARERRARARPSTSSGSRPRHRDPTARSSSRICSSTLAPSRVSPQRGERQERRGERERDVTRRMRRGAYRVPRHAAARVASAPMDLGIDGKVALVTAASKGLGFAQRRGARGRGLPRGDLRPRRRTPGRGRGRAAGRRRSRSSADVTDPDVPARLVDGTVERFGAARHPRRRTRAVRRRAARSRSTDERRRRRVEANLLTSIRLVRAAVPHMRAGGRRADRAHHVERGQAADPDLAHSNVARTGLWGWAKTAAPGPGRRRHHAEPGLPRAARDRPGRASSGSTGRMGDPEDFGRVVAFLCSAHAGFVSGTALAGRRAAYAGPPVSTTKETGVDANARPPIADDCGKTCSSCQPALGTFVGDERLRRPAARSRRRRARAPRSRCSRGALDELGSDRPGSAATRRPRSRWTCSSAVANRMLAAARRSGPTGSTSASHMMGPAHDARRDRVAAARRHPERLDRVRGAAPRVPGVPRRVGRDRAARPSRRGVTAPRVVVERTLGQLERILALAPRGLPGAAAGRRRRRRAGSDRDGRARGGRPRARDASSTSLRDDYLPAATETIGLVGTAGRRRRCTRRRSLAWTSLPLDAARRPRSSALERFDGDPATSGTRSRPRSGIPTPPTAIAARTASGDEHRARRRGPRWRSSRSRSPGAGKPLPLLRAAALAPTARSAGSRSSARPTSPSPSTTRRPRTARGRASTTSTLRPRATAPLHHLAERHVPRGEPRPPLPDRARAGDARPPAAPPVRRLTWPAARSPRDGGSTASGSPTRWACTSTSGSGSGCSRTRRTAPRGSITDTGIHALGWDAGARRSTKLEEAGQTHTDAVIEVDRYIAMPGQALCYMIGMIEIENGAREAADGATAPTSRCRTSTTGCWRWASCRCPRSAAIFGSPDLRAPPASGPPRA